MIAPTVVATIIPAKPFAESKKRLSPVLSHQERVLLSQNLLRHTILAAMPIGPVVVVSRSATVRRFSANIGAYSLTEEKCDLNDAIRRGIDWAQTQNASSGLILPLDLPLLTTAVLEKLVAKMRKDQPGIIIAPCRRNQGTNTLVLSPPQVIPPKFGPHSFAKHQQLALSTSIQPTICHSPELAFDLDTPDDWLELTRLTPNHQWLGSVAHPAI